MKKAYLAILLAAVAMSSTACGTISPSVQTQSETAITEAVEPTEEPTVPTKIVDKSEEEQIKSNTFIADFFDSAKFIKCFSQFQIDKNAFNIFLFHLWD